MQKYPGWNVHRWQRFDITNTEEILKVQQANNPEPVYDSEIKNLQPYWTKFNSTIPNLEKRWAGQVGKSDVALETVYRDAITRIEKKRVVIIEIDGNDQTLPPPLPPPPPGGTSLLPG